MGKKRRSKPATIIVLEHGDKEVARLVENYKTIVEGNIQDILRKLGLI